MRDIPNWISKFFNSGNKIQLEKVLNDEYPASFNSLLKCLVEPALYGEYPIFLPLSTDRLWFYAIAEDIRELMELKRVLASHLGSVDIHPNLLLINTTEKEIEHLLLDKFPFGFIRFTLREDVKENIDSKIRVFTLLAKILRLYKSKPILTSIAQRPLGRVMRDFFTSCQLDDGRNAYLFFEELKYSGNFSQRNILFLELQALYASNKFNEIVEHKNLPDLLQGRLPQRITQILLRSVNHDTFERILSEDALPDGELDFIRVNCVKLTSLYERRPNLEFNKDQLHDWKLWALGSAIVGSSLFKSSMPPLVDISWLDRLSQWVGIDLDDNENINYEVRVTAPTNLDGVVSLLHKSLEANSRELSLIVELLKDIPEDLRKKLVKFPKLESLLISLLVEDQITQNGGWNDWFTEISKPNAVIVRLGQELHTSYLHWKSDDFDESLILECLSECSSDQVGGVFRDALPLLISWLDQKTIKCSANFWIIWLELLALDSIVSAQDINLAELLVNNFLLQPYTSVEYVKAIEPLEILWEKGKSPSCFTAGLELMETLLEASCLDSSSRTKLWLAIQGFSLLRWNRLSFEERYLTKSICSEILGEEACDIFPSDSSDDEVSVLSEIAPNLKGKLLVIYTLTEGAARRATTILEKMFCGLQIEVNHDHTATSNLINLAKKADYFVFAANSSKHQAYYPVSKIRAQLIYPQGKGASSIVTSFRNFLTKATFT